MNFFSRHSDQSKNPKFEPSVPQDILDAVSVMKSSGVASDDKVPEKIAPQSKGASPFLERTVPQEHETIPTPREMGTPFSKKPDLKPARFDKKKVVLMVLGGLAVLTLLGSTGWWYFMRFGKQADVVILPTDMENVTSGSSEPIVETLVSEPPYAPETPNYLPIDTETVTGESFLQMLKQSGDRIVAAQMVKPVEFLLTDKNNNPIAFSRFVYLMKLSLKAELMATLGEPFSLFVFNDNGNAKFGLRLSFADSVMAKKLITQNEKTLPFLLRTLLFNDIVVPREVVFRSGAYNIEVVRFVNIDVTRNLSFDFVVRDDGMFIGTSKEMLRAVLDKNR